MKSPFPGMDPYIEACGLWADFHNHFVEKIFDHLAAALPERYLARTGERSYVVLVEEEGKEHHTFLPNGGVKATLPVPDHLAGTTAAVTEPATETKAVSLWAFIDRRYRETFIEIYETEPEQRLVTSIEVLSPSNKRPGSEGWNVYLRSCRRCCSGPPTSWRSTCCAAATSCPCSTPGPPLPIRCSSAA